MPYRVIDGKSAMKGLTIEVDMGRIERQALGLFHWRLRLARLLIRAAAAMLRCNVEITS
jgi:hypothetical protein